MRYVGGGSRGAENGRGNYRDKIHRSALYIQEILVSKIFYFVYYNNKKGLFGWLVDYFTYVSFHGLICAILLAG